MHLSKPMLTALFLSPTVGFSHVSQIAFLNRQHEGHEPNYRVLNKSRWPGTPHSFTGVGQYDGGTDYLKPIGL